MNSSSSSIGYQLTMNPMFKQLHFTLKHYCLSPNSNIIYQTAPNLPYLQTETKVLKDQPGQLRSKAAEKGQNSMVPRCTSVSRPHPPYSIPQGSQHNNTEVLGRSKTNPLPGNEWAFRALLAEHLVLVSGTYSKVSHSSSSIHLPFQSIKI